MKPYISTNIPATDLLFMVKDYWQRAKKFKRSGSIRSITLPYIPGEGHVIQLDVVQNAQALNQFLTK